MAEARRRWNWRVRQRVTRGLLFVAAGSVPLLAAAPSAAAVTATGSLYLDGLLATVTVGTPMSFTASLTNDGPDRVDKMRLLIRISATGVEPQGVRLDHRELDGTWTMVTSKAGNKGDVKFIDDSYRGLSMDPGAALTGRYRLTFLAGSPQGLAVIASEAQHKTDGTWQSLVRSPQYVTNVVAAQGVGGVANGASPGSPKPGISRTVSPTPFGSPAPTVGVDASAGHTTGIAASGSSGAGQRSDPTVGTVVGAPTVTGRVATLVGIGITVVLLFSVAWLLRRHVKSGGGGGPLDDGPGPGAGWGGDR